ncbi:hypothetical protein FRZ61_32940 [Hypericibacter adhaerens]|uniref:Uncharacterized protein n=1 Tax=Hypericibacter adhaerens TaxID=2602016 RepID=A0A5J6N827_9PROT|nr:hypothetical protein [Hypericibacter adhaerens]QEX23356.1 hypothetical protein FRZ61_32940 [Hypericibacter adhaerens]
MAESKRHYRRLLRVRERADAVIRRYKFIDSTNPEGVERYKLDRPSDDDQPVRILYNYAIAHPVGTRSGMVWCCYCQERTHFDGSVVEYSSDARRTVGKDCCKKNGLKLQQLRDAFVSDQVRKDRLEQFDRIGRHLPELIKEIDAALLSTTVRAFSAQRSHFQQNCGALFKFLAGIVQHNRGLLTWDEKITDYARDALSPETQGDGFGDVSSRKARNSGQKILRLKRYHRITGRNFLDLSHSPINDLQYVRDKLVVAMEFYSQPTTDQIEDHEFGEWARALSDLVARITIVEKTLSALPEFFGRLNLSTIVFVRNEGLREPRYAMTSSGIKWTPEDGEPVVVEPPRDYQPLRFRLLPRMKRYLRAA